MCEKHLLKSDILSKEADRWSSYNVTLPQVFFAYFTSENHLPGFSITGTLAWNGLTVSIEYMVPKEFIPHVLQNVF